MVILSIVIYISNALCNLNVRINVNVHEKSARAEKQKSTQRERENEWKNQQTNKYTDQTKWNETQITSEMNEFYLIAQQTSILLPKNNEI